jgi:hypothetical protein
MHSDFNRFIKGIGVITLVVLVIGAIMFRLVIPGHYLCIFPYTLLFFVGLSVLFYYILLKIASKRTMYFINGFILGSAGKLFLYFLFFAIYVYLNREKAIPFTVVFLSLYIVFTIHEVISFLNFLKKNKHKSG